MPINYHHALPHHMLLLLCGLHHPPLFLNSICHYLPTFSLDLLGIYTFPLDKTHVVPDMQVTATRLGHI